jgi:hypothetical protein
MSGNLWHTGDVSRLTIASIPHTLNKVMRAETGASGSGIGT